MAEIMDGGFDNTPDQPPVIPFQYEAPGFSDTVALPPLETVAFLPDRQATADNSAPPFNLLEVSDEVQMADYYTRDLEYMTATLIQGVGEERFDEAMAQHSGAPGRPAGHFERLTAELAVLTNMVSGEHQDQVAQLHEQYDAHLAAGRQLERQVVTAANREAAMYRQQLAAEADWAAILDAGFEAGSPDSSQAYRKLSVALDNISGSRAAPAVYYHALAARNALHDTYHEMRARGDVLPERSDAWRPPDVAWRPRPYFGQEIARWTDDVCEASDMIARERVQFLSDSPDLRLLGLLAGRANAMGVGRPLVYDIPPQLTYELETRCTAARDRLKAADAAWIETMVVELPAILTVEDERNIAKHAGIGDPEAWVRQQLQAIPAAMRRGLGTVRFRPSSEARTVQYKGQKVTETASYQPPDATINLYIDTDSLPADRQLDVGQDLDHEVMHHAHNWLTPLAVLVDFRRHAALDGRHISEYAAAAADPNSPWPAAEEQFAETGMEYYRRQRERRMRPDSFTISYHHHAFREVEKRLAG